MARGTESKNIITNKILEIFPGSFQYDKEIRIPIVENGETIQIKVTLTAAKANVENGGDSALPSSDKIAPIQQQNLDLTEEEKNNVIDLVTRLGL